MNEAEKKIAEALLKKITDAIGTNDGDPRDRIQTYDAFLQTVERRIGIDQSEKIGVSWMVPDWRRPDMLTATGVERWNTERPHAAIEAAETQHVEPAKKYWNEYETVDAPFGEVIAFNFGRFGPIGSPDTAFVKKDDAVAAREWLIAAAPTMQALTPFHQARSFADKWAANKRPEA